MSHYHLYHANTPQGAQISSDQVTDCWRQMEAWTHCDKLYDESGHKQWTSPENNLDGEEIRSCGILNSLCKWFSSNMCQQWMTWEVCSLKTLKCPSSIISLISLPLHSFLLRSLPINHPIFIVPSGEIKPENLSSRFPWIFLDKHKAVPVVVKWMRIWLMC